MWKYVANFRDRAAERVELAGGKGANLSKLTRAGFPVPPGFVVMSPAYRAFLESAGEMRERVRALPFDCPELLVSAAAELRAYLSSLPLPGAVVSEVRAALAASGEGAYGVRSSSTFEDLAGAAFAGQHDTYLNCSGEGEILSRIRDCFVSLWQDRAIAYRHSRSFDPEAAAMAVVVQRMIRPEVAGVGFSVDPVSGRDAMLVNANYGLGESVVSGEGEADQFVLSRETGEPVESFVAHKTVKIVPDEETGQGTRAVALAGEKRDRSSLNAAQLRELGCLMLRVERFYRFPQDIEWGIEEGALYLLQSRPVTSMAPRWTRDESAERYPSAMTPMSWDLIEDGFHQSLDYSFRLMGFPPFDGKWFAMFDNYVYGNQNAVRFYLGMLPFTPANADELRAGMAEFARKYDWALDLPADWMRGMDRYLLQLGALSVEPLEDRTLEELWRFVERVSEIGVAYFKPNIAISITQSVLYRSLLAFMRLFAGDRALDLFDRLTAYCQTRTSLVNRELRALAAVVRGDEALAEALRGATSERFVKDGIAGRFPPFDRAFARFLEDHGHREVEFDPYIPTWLEAPWIVLDNLKLILAAEPGEEGLHGDLEVKRSASEAESELFALLPPDTHLFFREMIRLVRLYTELDDLEHYQTTRLHLPLRRGLLALGGRLAADGVLDEPGDIFFARRARAEECARGETPWRSLSDEVRAEKAAYLENRKKAPVWTLGEDTGDVAAVPDASELSGFAGSPGVAEGEVFVIESSDDFASFPKGAVLVARTTNPAWTPLFYAASALVTESGGPLSHGAVTAREMKIPAVMSVRGVLSVLKNGDRVRVDGGRGRVYRID